MNGASMANTPNTELCTHSLTGMSYRDKDLVNDLIGERTFTDVMFTQIMGRRPRPVDLRIIDAVLITLMEHGLTPSAIATRLIYMSARSEEHTSELKSLMRISYAVFCLKTQINKTL